MEANNVLHHFQWHFHQIQHAAQYSLLIMTESIRTFVAVKIASTLTSHSITHIYARKKSEKAVWCDSSRWHTADTCSTGGKFALQILIPSYAEQVKKPESFSHSGEPRGGGGKTSKYFYSAAKASVNDSQLGEFPVWRESAFTCEQYVSTSFKTKIPLHSRKGRVHWASRKKKKKSIGRQQNDDNRLICNGFIFF